MRSERESLIRNFSKRLWKEDDTNANYILIKRLINVRGGFNSLFNVLINKENNKRKEDDSNAIFSFNIINNKCKEEFKKLKKILIELK